MNELTITVNQDTMDWLHKRCLSEQCTIEDFIGVIIQAVAINSIINQKQNHNETIQENATL
jgi:hypothetical protein